MTKTVAILASVAALALFAASSFDKAGHAVAEDAPAAAASCDHDCLTGFVDAYLKALVAHDPAQLAVAPKVRFTENTVSLKLGDALWGTISGLGDYKMYFADPQTGQAGVESTIRENGTPAILFLRIRVVNRQIAEVEHIVHRGAEDALALEKLGHPNSVWLEPMTPTEQTSRVQMLKDVNLYYTGILHSDGNMVPFDLRCNRVLDGYQDTNHPGVKGWFHQGSWDPDYMNIRDNMNTGVWVYIHSVWPRHFWIVDEKMGIVAGVFMFNHPGTVASANVSGVGVVPMPALARRPSSLDSAEFFKIEAGKIRQIEGVTVAVPYGSGTGWDPPVK